LNVRQYLVKEKAIDPSRIELRLGRTPAKVVRNVFVPAGAIYKDKTSIPFDERTMGKRDQVPVLHGKHKSELKYPSKVKEAITP
jgi:hypothetical protein